MVKLFGQFLVEKGVISEKDLLSALMDQLRDMPTVCEVVYNENLLPPQAILQAMAVQTHENLDFVSACKKMGIWTAAIENKVRTVVGDRKIPLGQLLVKSGKVEFQSMVNALDEYLATQTDGNGETSGASPVVVETPVAPVPTPNPTTGLEATAVKNYVELFSDEKVAKVEALLGVAVQRANQPSADKPVPAVLLEIEKCIHELSGMARFIQAEKSEKLSNALETTIQTLAGAPEAELLSPVIDLLADLSKGTLAHLVGLRACLASTSSEEKYWNEQVGAIEKAMKDLDQVQKLFAKSDSTPNPMKEAA